MLRAIVLVATTVCGCGRVDFDQHVDASTDAIDARSGGSISFRGGATNNSSIGITISTTLDVVAGDLVIAGYAADPPSCATIVSDGQSNAYSSIVFTILPNYCQGLQYTFATATGPVVISATLAAASMNFFQIQALAYSGASAIGQRTGDTQTTPVGTATGPAVVTIGANEVVLAYVVGNPAAIAVGPGFTKRTSIASDLVEDEPAPVPASYPALFVETNGGAMTGTWTAQVVEIR